MGVPTTKIGAFGCILSIFASSGCTFYGGVSSADKTEQKTTPVFESAIFSQEEANADFQPWGVFHSYFQGRSIGAENILMGTASIKPGQEIHPPHAHFEEEFLMIIEGNGEWSLNGETMPAKEGDVLYAKPWDEHGVTNTGETTMIFVVWKWGEEK